MNSARSEKARDTTMSNPPPGCQASTRSQATVTLFSASSVFACCRNADFLWLDSRSVTAACGNASASGIPGSPPPLPTSRIAGAPARRRGWEARARVEVGPHRQASEGVFSPLFRGPPRGSGVVVLVPFLHPPHVRAQLRRRARRQLQPELRYPLGELPCQRRH